MRHRIYVAVLLGLACLQVKASEPPAAWSSQAKRQLADSEYEISWQTKTSLADVDAAWQSPNRAHGFRTYFTEEGIRVVPRTDPRPSWSFGLALTGIGRPAGVVAIDAALPRVAGNRVTYDRGRVLEWYVNAENGLEQGFTIPAAPGGTRGEVAIDLSITGSLKPSFAADRQAVEFKGDDRFAMLRYSGLTVVDAGGRRLAAHMEPIPARAEAGIRLVFDDRGAAYPVTVDPLFNATWSPTSGQNGAWYGYAVSTAGDVNGDGYSDVIVGAPSYDNGQSDEGRAYVYLGSASGLSTTAAWTSESDQAAASYGWSVATAGDVNGDGYDEVLVGANNFTNGDFQEGKAYLFYGSASGLSATPGWTNEGNQNSAYYGTAVATAGDVNNDGYADVIVSAPYANGATFSIGRVYLYLGSASGLAATPAWTKDGPSDIAFGSSISTAGDVNGDGYADVIIGAEFNDTDLFNQGRAYLFLGVPGGLALSPVWSADGDQAGAQFGHSVANAGDVNGDGYADVIIGEPWFDNGQDTEGRVYIFHGNAGGLSLIPNWATESDNVGARYGISVATAGDVNGDGYADVVIGAERYFSGQGRVSLFLGGPGGVALTPAFYRDGNVPGEFLGAAVATAGDVDGDGFSDLLVGSYGAISQAGKAYVWRCSGGDDPSITPAWHGEGDQLSSSYGVSVASAGDVNGDGYSDVIVGQYLYDNGDTDEGRALLYLGSASGLSTTPVWSVEGNHLVAEVGLSVASAGDVNGDGYADVILNDFFSTGGGVRAFYGSPTGLPLTPSWSAAGGGGGFGTSVASAGDVNGDGYSDVIVGAPYFTGDQSVEGAALVYLGSPTGLAALPAWTVQGNQTGSYFGFSVASAGDVNRDGYSDVIVGAYGFDNGQTDEGRAYVYLGSASGLASTPTWTTESNVASEQYGLSVASAGDVNGDGYADVVVSGPHPTLNLPGLYVYFGSPSGLPVTPSWTSNTAAYNVAPAGDYDNDGYSDFLVWSPAATLYRGSPSGFFSTAIWWNPPSYEAVLGLSSPIASAGDVNGDGFADVIVGWNQYTHDVNHEGGAFVYLGNGTAPITRARARMPRQVRSDSSTPIALLGKSDSETGFRLLAPGFSAAGRADIRLRWEVKPLGTPFNRSGLGSSALTDTGTPGVAGSVASFNQSASGLGEGTSYHWRARTESANPFFPRSPWMSATGNGQTETKLRMSGCVDLDGDGYGAGGDASCLSLTPDCNDADATAWDTPGQTTNLRFSSGKTTLSWNVPANLGTLASAIRYDTIRATSPGGFQFGFCVESDDGPNTTATDFDLPGTGSVFFYLNRAQNTCPQGVGSLGTDSFGTLRLARPCP